MSAKPQIQSVTATAFRVAADASREGNTLNVLGNETLIKISSRDTENAFAVFEGFTPPHAGPPLHRHLYQDEWWYIFEGEFLFEVDGEEIRAQAGDTVFAPRGSAHTFQNVGEKTGRTLTTVVPGGLDIFFEELSEMVPEGAPFHPSVVRPLFQKHGLELLGPPIAERTKR